MKKLINNIMMMAFIATTAIVFTSCEDAKIARTLEGTWRGNMYISSYYGGRSYDATYTEITFLKDPGAYSSGNGYWVDYYSNAPWDYVANHIEWTVDYGVIKVYFVEENAWIDLYMFALIQFSFEDYETYVESSSDDMIQTGLNFCDEIISRALINDQFLVFRLALSAKAHVYAYDGDYDSFMDYDLQHYILGLNPISLNAEDYSSYEIISEANIINLRNVLEKVEVGNLKKRFDNIWNKSNIKHATVPKKTSFKILKRAIAGADIEELNFELREKYFNKKFGF